MAPGRWQFWQARCRIGATSFVKVTCLVCPMAGRTNASVSATPPRNRVLVTSHLLAHCSPTDKCKGESAKFKVGKRLDPRIRTLAGYSTTLHHEGTKGNTKDTISISKVLEARRIGSFSFRDCARVDRLGEIGTPCTRFRAARGEDH